MGHHTPAHRDTLPKTGNRSLTPSAQDTENQVLTLQREYPNQESSPKRNTATVSGKSGSKYLIFEIALKAPKLLDCQKVQKMRHHMARPSPGPEKKGWTGPAQKCSTYCPELLELPK